MLEFKCTFSTFVNSIKFQVPLLIKFQKQRKIGTNIGFFSGLFSFLTLKFFLKNF